MHDALDDLDVIFYGQMVISGNITSMITIDLLVAPLNICESETLGSNTAWHSDLPYLVTGNTESLEEN